jgi:3-methyl-2-oxobutanoate hydroxymethyltransferase
MSDKVTIHTLVEKKARGEPITMLTAYDYPTAKLVDSSGIDVILVGDSLGMVIHGLPNTTRVTMDMMVMHCAAVARGASRAMLVGDLPFLSYQVSVEEAVRNAGRLVADGGMDAVKLEGGSEMLPAIEALQMAGIAVQGHIGLTPQSISRLGGFKTQGRSAEAARQLLDDALALEAAGCFSLVLEAIPDRVAGLISRRLSIPTIGIGAGVECDGQVLVTHDVLGLGMAPKFVRQYADAAEFINAALVAFRDDVLARTFPAREHAYSMPDDEWETFHASVNSARQGG